MSKVRILKMLPLLLAVSSAISPPVFANTAMVSAISKLHSGGEIETAVTELAGFSEQDIEIFKESEGKVESIQLLESSLSRVVALTQKEEMKGAAYIALRNLAQLLTPERVESYRLIETTLLGEVTASNLEQRHRDRAALALERLPALSENTVDAIIQTTENDTNPPTSAVKILAKHFSVNDRAKVALLELAQSQDHRKRRLFAQEIIVSREPDDQIINRLTEMAKSDPDVQTRSWAIGAFRTGYKLGDKQLSSVIEILSNKVRDEAETIQNRELAVASLSTLIREEPREYTDVLVEIAKDSKLNTDLRANAIGVLPFASRYSTETGTVLEELQASGDAIISAASKRALEILEKRSR